MTQRKSSSFVSLAALFFVLNCSLLLSFDKVIKISELDYKLPMKVRGLSPELSLVLPHYTGINYASSEAEFHLNFSPSLSPQSAITITVNNIPLYASTVDVLGHHAVFKIPLAVLSKLETKLPLVLKIRGYFLPIDKQGVESEQLWMELQPLTSLHFKVDPVEAPTLSFLLGSPNKKVFLEVENNSPENILALMQVASAIGAIYHPWNIEVSFDKAQESAQSIVIGGGISEPRSKGRIHITPDEAEMFFENLMGESKNRHEQIEDHQLTLSDLDIGTQKLKGVGDLVLALPFKLADFDRYDQNINFTIYLSHTPLAKNEAVYLSFRINGLLLHGYQLSQSGEFVSYSIDIPIRVIEARNLLEMIVSYYPDAELENRPLGLETTIFSSSFFSLIGTTSSSPLNISDFPRQFLGKGLVVLSDYTPAYYQTAAKILEMGSRILGKPLNINVSKVKKKVIRQEPEPDYWMVIANPRDLNLFHPLVDTSQHFEFINNDTEKVLFRSKWGITNIVQIFKFKEKSPLIAFTNLDSPALGWLDSLSEHHLENFETPVAMYDESQWHSIPLGKGVRIEYEYLANLDKKDFWKTYRFLFVFPLGLIILYFLRYVYQKLTREESPNVVV